MTARPLPFSARRDEAERETPDVAVLLGEIRDELRAIHAALPGLRRPLGKKRRRVASADRTRLALLLPVLAESVGDLAFTSTEVVERAALPDDVSQRLGVAIAASVGSGRSTARRLGLLLGRGEGLRIGGMELQQVARERDGVVWLLRLLKVARESHAPLRRAASVR